MNVQTGSLERIFDEQQEKIVGFCKKPHDDARSDGRSSRKWSKFKGNSTTQIVRDLLNEHLAKYNARAVGPDVFLQGKTTSASHVRWGGVV